MSCINNKVMELNKMLVQEYETVVSSTVIGSQEDFIKNMVQLFNDKEAFSMTVKCFDDVEEIQSFLDDMNAVENLMEFYKKYDDLSDSIAFKEFNVPTYFIKKNEFADFVKDVLCSCSDSDVIFELNNFLMTELYKWWD